MPSCRAAWDVRSVKIEASYPAWLCAGREKSWRYTWRSIKSMSRNYLCGFQVQKAACGPLCSRTVAKPDWCYSEAQSAEPDSFSPVLGESRSWIPMKLSTCLPTAWNWRILVLGGAKSQIWVGCLIEAFWCVLIPTPRHRKSAGSLTWRLSFWTCFFSFCFPQIWFLPAGHTF